MAGSVGAAKDFFAAHCKIPRARIGHYLSVVEDHAGGLIAISGCCDPVDDNARMLRQALFALTRKVALDPSSEAVIVSKDDLKAAIDRMHVDGQFAADARQRLSEALGEADNAEG